MFSIFKKNEDSGNGAIDKILSTAKMFGIDIPAMVEKKIPELVEQAKVFQEKAGYPLFLSIALDDEQEHFVIGLWKLGQNGADVLRSYKLTDIPSIISQIQFDLNNISDDTTTSQPESITIGSTGTDTTDTTGTAESTGATTATEPEL